MANDRWNEQRVVASIWWCGDDHCDCTQPVVEIIGPNTNLGRPWIRRETLWSGAFMTDTGYASQEERAAQQEELREAAWWYGAEIEEPGHG